MADFNGDILYLNMVVDFPRDSKILYLKIGYTLSIDNELFIFDGQRKAFL